MTPFYIQNELSISMNCVNGSCGVFVASVRSELLKMFLVVTETMNFVSLVPVSLANVNFVIASLVIVSWVTVSLAILTLNFVTVCLVSVTSMIASAVTFGKLSTDAFETRTAAGS